MFGKQRVKQSVPGLGAALTKFKEFRAKSLDDLIQDAKDGKPHAIENLEYRLENSNESKEIDKQISQLEKGLREDKLDTPKQACYNAVLGFLHLKVKKDRFRAKPFLEKAANMGHLDAHVLLCDVKMLEKAYIEVLPDYKKAEEKGPALSMYRQFKAHEKDERTKSDYELLHKAMKAGSIHSYFQWGFMRSEGVYDPTSCIGRKWVRRDLLKAALVYRNGIAAGSYESVMALANLCLQKGFDTFGFSRKEAAFLFDTANTLGFKPAMEGLSELQAFDEGVGSLSIGRKIP